MRILARTAAFLSATLTLFPAIWLLTRANLIEEPIALILGLFLISFACFSGTTLWLQGERWHLAQSGPDQEPETLSDYD